VKDGKADQITREPEQVKAFRDTWRDGIHSYLTYLRDRLTVARDLLTDSGSIFVQIGDENVHLVRSLMDEVFGADNYVAQIIFRKTSGKASDSVDVTVDFLLLYARSRDNLKIHQAFEARDIFSDQNMRFLQLSDGQRRPLTKHEVEGKQPIPAGARVFRNGPITSSRPLGEGDLKSFELDGVTLTPGKGTFKSNLSGLTRLKKAGRLLRSGNTLGYLRFFEDFAYGRSGDIWDDTRQSGFGDPKTYVVQTAARVLERCIQMVTDPGDLVLDPTCGSGTTAFVAEQWGRRWITIDTSRVALALARARIMGARYPFYLLADSRDGQLKEAEVTRTAPSSQPVHGNIRHGFVYERVPHVQLSDIANNAEIDVIWDQWQARLEPLREKLNAARKKQWQEWEIPRVAEDPWDANTQELFYVLKAEQGRGEAGSSAKLAEWLQAINRNLKRNYTLKTLPERPADPWPEADAKLHADWWQARIARQKEIDASIAGKAEFEYLYDKPYPDNKKVRVAGPFSVESLNPHRVLGVNEDDELIDTLKEDSAEYGAKQSFPQMILENLKTAGVKQAHKEDKIAFTALTAWPGELVCGEGRYLERDAEKRAAIFIGPEFGTVQRADLVAAAREAGDAGFDVLIACAFNYEAHTTEFRNLGRIPVLKGRMNADLHMAEDLKNTGKGNLFVIFGEPDIELITENDGKLRVRVKGVDVFKPQIGEVISDGADGIACWFIDTDYNEESFFVRHAYFLGANDPYSALKTTLKAEINEEAWATLNSDTSRPFDKPKSGRIAVKVINHLGDEVMKVFRV
jgi:adenine-specific DNA-methyltransferase